MRVALVHNYYRSGLPSGENVAVTNQAALLVKGGHEVHVIEAQSDTLNHFTSKLNVGLSIATRSGAFPIDRIKKIEPDIVHVHNTFPIFGTKWMKEIEFPITQTLHNFRPICAAGTLSRNGVDCFDCPSKGAINAVKHGCYRGSPLLSVPGALATMNGGARYYPGRVPDSFIALSQWAKDTYEKYSYWAKPIYVLPNFASSSILEETSDRDGFVYVGRLSEEKGIEPLVASWPREVPLIVLGDGPLLDHLRELAANKRVTFEGPAAPDRVRYWMSKSEALVFPSVCRENSPMVYPEALSEGLPVLALDRNTVADQVIQDSTGIVYGQALTLSSAISQIRSQADVLSKIASRVFETRYSPSVWLKRLEHIYGETIALKSSQ